MFSDRDTVEQEIRRRLEIFDIIRHEKVLLLDILCDFIFSTKDEIQKDRVQKLVNRLYDV